MPGSRKISFSRAERAAVERAIHWFTQVDEVCAEPKHAMALRALLAKMDRAAEPAPPTASDFLVVQPAEFVRLARDLLGELAFVPANTTPGWWNRIGRALKTYGVTEEVAQIGLTNVRSWAKRPQDVAILASRIALYASGGSRDPAPEEEGEQATTGRPPELR